MNAQNISNVIAIEDAILGLFVKSGLSKASATLPLSMVQHLWQHAGLNAADLEQGLQTLEASELCRSQTCNGEAAVQLTELGSEYLQCGAEFGERWQDKYFELARALKPSRLFRWMARRHSTMPALNY